MIDVLLLRDERSAMATKKQLIAKNVTFFHEPLFEIEYFQMQIEMKNHDFLLITSMNAVLNLKYINVPVLVVGEKLANFIQEKFGATVIFIAKNAEELYKFIIKNALQNRKFFYLRGTDISFDFKKFLSNLNEKIAYEVSWKENFSQELINLFQNEQIKNIFFYSQNCAQHFISLIKKNILTECMRNVNVILLSENILRILMQINCNRNIFAESEEKMIDYINN